MRQQVRRIQGPDPRAEPAHPSARAEKRVSPSSAPSRHGGRHWLKLLGTAVVAAIWGGLALLALLAWFAYDLPDVRNLHTIARRPAVTMETADGSVIATFGDLYGDPVALSELPSHLPQAVLATEDRRFYTHFGLDVYGLARAFYVNLWVGRLAQGGSTVTQQLAKNVFLTPERTVKRKVQETLLALWLEAELSKDQILELYLNRVYFGAGAYGVEAAAQRYFDKPASQLTLAESAMLTGLLKAPSRYSPIASPRSAQNRANQVLLNMVNAGFMDEAVAKTAEAQPARLAPSRLPVRNVRYFADWVFDDIDDYIGLRRDDLVIVTTLDMRLQLAAEHALTSALAKDAERLNVDQGALIALSPNGAVRAMVGGRDYRESVFNRATQARRQPGSAFKLFVYLAGLESGLSPDDQFYDGPISVGNWRPRNFEGGHAGNVTLRQAMARSINTVSVQVSEQVGRAKVIEAARRLGLTGELSHHPSIALGVSEVSLVQLTGAYGAVATGGKSVLPHGILEIRDRAGNVLYRRSGGGGGRVLAERTAADLADLLMGVIDNGTGRGARLDRPAAGKTGTSQDFRDAWFIGFTSDVIAGVWVGNDDGGPMNRVAGSGLPARIWKNFMREAVKGTEPMPLIAAPAEVQFLSLWQKIIRQFGGGIDSRPERRDASTGRLLGSPPRYLDNDSVPSASEPEGN